MILTGRVAKFAIVNTSSSLRFLANRRDRAVSVVQASPQTIDSRRVECRSCHVNMLRIRVGELGISSARVVMMKMIFGSFW